MTTPFLRRDPERIRNLVRTFSALRTCGRSSPGTCGYTYVPSGTATTTQPAGDCRRSVCDGSGATVIISDATDLPDDANACTNDVCTSGTPSHTSVAAGSACSLGSGMGVCTGGGSCTPCGGTVQRCCAGYPYCRSGLSCQAGFCR